MPRLELTGPTAAWGVALNEWDCYAESRAGFRRAMSPFNTFLYCVDNCHQEQAGRFQQICWPLPAPFDDCLNGRISCTNPVSDYASDLRYQSVVHVFACNHRFAGAVQRDKTVNVVGFLSVRFHVPTKTTRNAAVLLGTYIP